MIKFSIKNSDYIRDPSINKAKRLIRWKPKIKIETNLRKLFSLMNNNNNIIMNCYLVVKTPGSSIRKHKETKNTKILS